MNRGRIIFYLGVERRNNSIPPPASSADSSLAFEASMFMGWRRNVLGDPTAGEDGGRFCGNVELRESGLLY